VVAEVRLEETNREAAEVAEMGREVVAEMDREEAAEMDREAVAETDKEAVAEMDREVEVAEAKVIANQEAEVVEADLATTEEEVEGAKWLVAAELNVTAGQETDVDVTTSKKNPTLYKLVAVVGVTTVARQVDTLTETSACEWMSQATMNRTVIKTIPTDMAVVTTQAMIKATIRATTLLRVTGAVHPVEGAVVEDEVQEVDVLATAIPEKVANKTLRVNLRKDNNNQKEDRRTERVRVQTLPMQLPIILLLW
jgi:hypothetical protein